MKSSRDGGQRKRVSFVAGLLGSVVLAAFIMLVGRTGILWDLELKSYDARFLWRGPTPPDSSEIVIVAIDDECFKTLGERWPFPRKWFARAIRNLFAAGAKLVVFDVQFDRPSDPEDDAELAAATREYAGRIIHAGKIAFVRDEHLDSVLTDVVLPIDQIREAGAKLGIVNEVQDPDGFTRQYLLFVEHKGVNYLPLSLKALQLVRNIPDTSFHREDPKVIRFGDVIIPRTSEWEHTMLTNFYGPTGTFQTYSLSTVLDDAEFDLSQDDTDYMQWLIISDEEFQTMETVLPEESRDLFRSLRKNNPFKNKIVFIGASASDLQDNKKTPFFTYVFPDGRSRNIETPGVEVHANALQTILDRSYITNVPPLAELLLLFLLAFAVYLLNNATRFVTGTVLTILLGGAVTALIFLLFIEYRIWFAMVTPTMSIAFAYVGTTAYRFVLEQREKAMIRGMFAQYVPRKVVNELIRNPDLLVLGGEKRKMTVLFCDIAGFTGVSEKLSPDELVHMLNEYLSEMSKVILEHEGIIDKYEGDLIMAEWGAPVYFSDHSEKACRAALEMQKHLAAMREDWKTQGKTSFFSRIGINTGEMIVGNMGCLEVFDYTVIGDAVNLASRLEGANKAFGTDIMIGEETRSELPDNFVTREIDLIRVKGKERPVHVFELVAENLNELSPEKRELLERYSQGLELYKAMHFKEGKQLFEQARALEPADGPCNTYVERCMLYSLQPPAEDWDGVFVLTEK